MCEEEIVSFAEDGLRVCLAEETLGASFVRLDKRLPGVSLFLFSGEHGGGIVSVVAVVSVGGAVGSSKVKKINPPQYSGHRAV